MQPNSGSRVAPVAPVKRRSTAQGRALQYDAQGRPFRSEVTQGPNFNLSPPARNRIAVRSPTVENPGTPDEVRRAFGGPITFAPGASREQTAAAASRLAGPRFGPGEYQQYQQAIGVNTNPAPTSPSAEEVSRIQGIVGASPARQFRQAQAARAPATRFVDGQGYMPNARPAYGTGGGGVLPDTQAGVGMQTSGVGSGGRMGTPLMRGGMPGPAPVARKPFEYAAGRGPTITSPGGQSEVVSPEAFQQMWNSMSGESRGGALRATLEKQRERAAADPRIAANIAKNEAAIQRQTGGAPAPGVNPLFDRERQRKELTKAGMPRPMAATFANLQGNPEAQAAMFEQLAGEETERMQSYNQPFGGRGVGGRGDRGGMGVAGVVGAQERARENAAKQKYDNDMLKLEQIKTQWTPRLSLAQAALAPGSTATPAEKRAAQQTIDEYNRFTDSTFGGRQSTTPVQPGSPQGGQLGTSSGAPIPPEYVPYGNSGVMVDPQSVTQLETTAANYSANPAAVGAQLVQMLNGPEFAHLDATKKQALLQDLVGRYRPNPTLAKPEGIYGGNRGPSFDGGSMGALGFAGGIM